MKYIIIAIALIFFTQLSYASCNANEQCPVTCVRDIFSGSCTSIKTSDPACEMRKAACNGCIASTAIKLGASVQCVACVVGALVTTGGSVLGACTVPCGGAAVAEKIAKENGC